VRRLFAQTVAVRILRSYFLPLPQAVLQRRKLLGEMVVLVVPAVSRVLTI
jgi:hypothetical protein